MIVLTTPFAGKRYCFNDYYSGIELLDYPKDKIFALWLDNSNDKAFHELLEDKIRIFGRHKLIVDNKPHHTIENSSDYAKISFRCWEVYKAIQNSLPDIEGYMFNIEDDVWVPPDSLNKMLEIFSRYEKVGTVVGSCKSRRLKDTVYSTPIAWTFKQTKVFPYADTSKEVITETRRILNPPPFGIHIIGAAHMGCWLAPIKLIKKLGFKLQEDGLTANDIVWGYRITKAGYHFVIDWSIHTRHYWQVENVKGYY